MEERRETGSATVVKVGSLNHQTVRFTVYSTLNNDDVELAVSKVLYVVNELSTMK
jgi:hypothetical protein